MLLGTHTTTNFPITTEDVDISENIFGPDMIRLKEKITTTKPKKLRRDDIEISKLLMQQHHNLELAIDILYVNGMEFISRIDRLI